MVATSVSLWSGVELSLCSDFHFFRKGIPNGLGEEDSFRGRPAVRLKPFLQLYFHLYTVRIEK
jgi:hypothetical protein